MPSTAGDQRRSEILEAVVRVTIDVGFTDMAVADVAQLAGVSNASSRSGGPVSSSR